MSNYIASIISPGGEWDKYLNIFNEYGLNDIYFHYKYLNLYVSEDSQALIESFVFQSRGEVFFLPYIRRPIDDSNNLWDFETVYGYSGPIATIDSDDFLDLAWQNFKRLMKKKCVIAGLIRFHPLLNNDKFCSDNSIEVRYERDTVWLDCKRSLTDVLSDYSKKHLKQLNSLTAKGVTIRSSNDVEDLQKFGEIYLERMKAIGARSEYHFSSEYFDKVMQLGSKNWLIYLAYTPNEKIMGGCLLLFSNKFCHYHLSGSLKEYIKYKPNDMLRHKVIQDMLKSDIEMIHFGGGLSKNPSDGLLSFKLKFSKQVSQFKVGYCIVDNEKYNSLCENWDKSNPENQEFSNFFLKYRY
jgi:hypothetical protein